MHQTGNEKVEKATKEFQNRKTRSKTLEAWDRVQISRRNDRPVAGHYIEVLFQDFIELHGDRYFADDTAIVGGIATFHGRAVTVIAQAKGQNTKENIGHNFWYAVTRRLPEGIASYEAGRKIPPPGHLLRRYAGSILWNFRRRARPGRGDCKKSV